MFSKSVTVFATCVLLVTASAIPITPIGDVVLEEACVLQGGMCLRPEDCPAGNQVGFNGIFLCPRQQHLGIKCCYV